MNLEDGKNYLFYGDNLDVLRRYIPDESVDLVYLDPPTAPMRTEAADAGFYSPGVKALVEKGIAATERYPRIQILTVDELLQGGKIDYPARGGAGNVTHRRAPKAKRKTDTAETERLI